MDRVRYLGYGQMFRGRVGSIGIPSAHSKSVIEYEFVLHRNVPNP